MSNPGPSTFSGRNLTSCVSGGQKVTGNRPVPPKGHSTVPPPLGPPCAKCGRQYQTRSGLLKHSKTCESRDRTACKFCGKQFDSFAGVRLHERAVHRELYDRELERSLSVPDAVTFQVMADIEAATKKGAPFIGEMVTATGLTKDQVRHCRAKPVYKQYLEAATNKRRRLSAGGTFFSAQGTRRPPLAAFLGSTPSAPTLRGPSLSRDADEGPSTIFSLSDARSSPSLGIAVPASQGSPPAEQIPATTPAILFSPDPPLQDKPTVTKRRRNDCSPISPGPLGDDDDFTIQPEEPMFTISSSPGPHFSQVAGPSGYVAPTATKRKRNSPQSHSTSSSDTDPHRANSARRPRTDRRPISTSPLSTTISRPSPPASAKDHPPLAIHRSQHLSLLDLRERDDPHARNDLFVEALFDLRTRIPESRGIVLNTISTALTGHPENLLAALDAWMASLAPQRPTRAPRPKTNGPRNYGLHTGGRGPKASAFKKAQDLYGKNRSTLADLIINGNDILAPDVTPPMAEVEAVYGSIFESPSPPDDEPYVSRPTLT